MECTEHYCNSGSLVCGRLQNEGTRGSQIFVVPRSGNYTQSPLQGPVEVMECVLTIVDWSDCY